MLENKKAWDYIGYNIFNFVGLYNICDILIYKYAKLSTLEHMDLSFSLRAMVKVVTTTI